MYALSEQQFLLEAAPALHKVFVDEDPYGRPFAPGVKVRRLLYPEPEGSVLDALAHAADAVGDTGFYLSIVERPVSKDQSEPDHWYMSLSEMGSYWSIGPVAILQHVLYSPSGQWGLMVSEETHGLLGGTERFFQEMCQQVPGFDDLHQIQEFLAYWKDAWLEMSVDISWIAPLLAHIYGKHVSRQVLEQAGLSSLLDSAAK